ncbi:PTS system mannose/fructose/sorbose family transporter subunit IID [Propionispora vibrioides]|uniref:PTS system IID component, Man family n=1 Tax=Propionispora vibrioides TaxID=112903 RepID=A0A1H8SHN0_9FIRM|nr:PTS system mannose/fructose/sorbose family transporter subunit IID [Propionispora vibrioides]SEO78182.1 PTS system IID component, Man family [Propionispora vibrioides]
MSDQNEKRLLSKKDLMKAFLIWETFPQTCYNYERMMGQACAHMFAPLIMKLYKNDPEKRKETMRREIEFFNVHIEFGACILGMAVAMEEQKALGTEVPGEFITSIKTSLMGPLSGVGDTIWQGVVIPILLAICIDITLSGTVAGSIIYGTVIVALAYAFSYFNFMFGYRSGIEAIMNFLEQGTLNKILKGAEIMGCMVMGGLISNYVTMKVGLNIVSSTSTFNVQTQFLDAIMPSILPFGFTLLVYSLLKRRKTSLQIIAMIIAIGVIGGLTGILV